MSDSGLLRAGRADFGGVLREVCLACVPEAGVGDYVIVHAGVAIGVLDEDKAGHSLDLLGQVLAEQNGSERPPEP